jgi:hypothetical protein
MALFPLGILSAAGVSGFSSDYELIASNILGTATSEVVFDVSTLASTYKHLQLRMVLRRSTSSQVSTRIRFNTDSGSNYAQHRLVGTGSSVVSAAATSVNAILAGAHPGSDFTANAFGPSVVDLLDPFSNTKNKTVRTFYGGPSLNVELVSGLWMNTNTITTMAITPDGSGDWVVGSRFSLYGIKG